MNQAGTVKRAYVFILIPLGGATKQRERVQYVVGITHLFCVPQEKKAKAKDLSLLHRGTPPMFTGL